MSIEIFTSGIWQLSSVIIASGGEVMIVDPGYFPREIAEIRARAVELGAVRSIVFTHGHWDHVAGWRAFDGARVIGSPSLAGAVNDGSARAAKDLADARDFDGRWYVDRGAPLAWPARVDPLAEGAALALGSIEIEALTLPGHSADGLALRIGGVLIAGDYLSPLEIPFIDDLPAYRATLERLIALLPSLERVVPGHGPPLSPAEALAIARADLVYLDRLRDAGDDRALAVEWPRAQGVPGMDAHHAENVEKLRARRRGG